MIAMQPAYGGMHGIEMIKLSENAHTFDERHKKKLHTPSVR